jgi:four helix bundle protein
LVRPSSSVGPSAWVRPSSGAGAFGIDLASRLGMGVSRFEDLRMWQEAKRQSDRVFELTCRPTFSHDPEIRNQINAATLSVMNNISEGFLRRRDSEARQFLRYAAASNGEVRSSLHAAVGRKYLSEGEGNEFIDHSNVIGKMITRYQASLESSITRSKSRR